MCAEMRLEMTEGGEVLLAVGTLNEATSKYPPLALFHKASNLLSAQFGGRIYYSIGSFVVKVLLLVVGIRVGFLQVRGVGGVAGCDEDIGDIGHFVVIVLVGIFL
jgi:hypothetical protein